MTRALALALLVAGCATAPPVSEPAPVDVSVGHPTAERVPPGQAELREIRSGVWVHVSSNAFTGVVYPMNGLVVRDGDGLLLVDTAWGEAATTALLAAIDAEIGLPVRRAVATHFHDDRVSGAAVLAARGIPFLGAPLTHRLAVAEGRGVPSDTLASLVQPGDAVRIGPVEVYFPGAGHARDNVVVYVPEAGVLFGGCAVHEVSRTSAGNVADADLDAWPVSLRRTQARYSEVEVVVPGHGVPGGPELLTRSIELVEAARDER